MGQGWVGSDQDNLFQAWGGLPTQHQEGDGNVKPKVASGYTTVPGGQT